MPYLLDEDRGWGLSAATLKAAAAAARGAGLTPRALVIINPGGSGGLGDFGV